MQAKNNLYDKVKVTKGNWIHKVSVRFLHQICKCIWFLREKSSSFLRDVGDGWARWVIAHTGFGRLVNLISTRRGRLCPPPILLKGDAVNLTLIYNDVTSFPSWTLPMLSWFYVQDRYLSCSRTIIGSTFLP